MNGKKKKKEKTRALAWVGRNFGVQDCQHTHRFHHLFSRCNALQPVLAIKLISSKSAVIYLCCYDVR